jgi:hypothetical protein
MSRIGRPSAVAATKRALVQLVHKVISATPNPLRAAARHETRGRRLGWLAIVALLVFGPLTFNLAREPGFEASMALSPSEVKPYPAIHEPRYYRSLLADPELREQTRLNAGDGVVDYDDVSIGPGPKRAVLTVTVEARTPHSAQRLMNALGPQIAGATKRELRRAAIRDTERLRARLRRSSLTSDRRRALQRRVRHLMELSEAPPPRVVLGPPAELPPIDRRADQLVDDLPGDFPARPNPAWAALAGLFVGGTLWAICLVLLPPGGRRADVGPSQPA